MTAGNIRAGCIRWCSTRAFSERDLVRKNILEKSRNGPFRLADSAEMMRSRVWRIWHVA